MNASHRDTGFFTEPLSSRDPELFGAVTQELGRVVEPGGCALIREPIVSMGDWTKPRPGLTPRERGIPRRLLIDYVTEAGFEVVAERPCFFPGSRVISKVVRRSQFEHPILVRLDALLSRATLWNYRYHATTSAQKIRPTSTFLVLRRV